ncbi:MAG: HAMP domain-containing sensor histidine kinase [Roseiarcus sp.]|jgi:signal transduction histidine kinase
MRLTPKSLGGRLFLVAVVSIVVALVGAGSITGLILYRFIQGQVDQRLDTQIAAISSALVATPENRVALNGQIDGPPFDRPGGGWYFEIFDCDNRIRSASLGDADLNAPRSWPLEWLSRPSVGNPSGIGRQPLHFRGKSAVVGERIVTIVATAPRSAVWRPLLETLSSVLIALALAGVALVLAMLVQVRLGLRPLQALRAAVADVRAGRRERIPPNQPSEIAPLVDELNSLIADNIEGLARARRHVSNLAHGLKTPLANLAVALDERGRDPAGELHELIGQMDRRIRHHLGRARAAAQEGPARVRTPLAVRVADLLAIVPKIHPSKRIEITSCVAPDVAVACEAQDLDEMLGNLIDNAAKWAAKRMRVSASTAGGEVTIVIEDDGPGLVDDKAPEAMQLGQKLDESAPGYGFGLPITRELAELYGGGLELSRSDLGGVEARLTLPAAR